MTGKQIAILAIVVFFVGAATGRFAAPTKTQIVHDVQRVERLQDNTRIVKVEQKAKDGSETITTTIQKNIGEQKQEQKENEKTTERDSTHLLFSLMGSVNPLQGAKGTPSWGGQVQGRILGPIWIGGYAMASGELGISLGVGF